MRTRRQAADPSALDVPYLATAYGVSEETLQALIDAPNADITKVFLAAVANKAHEHDELRAEKLQLDVELENVVRTSESKVKAQKSTVTRHVKELEELRTKLNTTESAREALSAELDGLKNSTSGTGAETSALRQRVDTLEASNRDALALVESKAVEKDRLATELSEQHSKLVTLRREVGQLEEKNQSLENAASSQRFKEQSLQQEIDLLKKNSDWHSNELQTRSQEHTKFRKERNAQIAALQRELDDGTANVESLKRTEATLRERLDEVQAKADEAFANIAGLQDDFNRREQDFRTQVDSTKRLADLQAQNANTHKARLQHIQEQLDQTKDDAAEEISRLQAEIETERYDKEEAERKLAELEAKLEDLQQRGRDSMPGTLLRNGDFDPSTPGRMGSPAVPGTVLKKARVLSHTQLYSQYIQAKQDALASERSRARQQDMLDECLQTLAERAPLEEEMNQEKARLEADVMSYSKMLEEAIETRNTAVKEMERYQSEAETSEHEGGILRQQLRDLAAQVKILLVEAQSRDQGLEEMSAQERLELERAARGELDEGALENLSNTGRLISERLVIFHNVSELQGQNEQLLRVTRELGERMEGEEALQKQRQSASDAAEVDDLRKKLERYQDELNATATQIDSYIKERDIYRRMLQQRGTIQADTDVHSMFGQSIPATPQRNGAIAATPRSKENDDLQKVLSEQKSLFDSFRQETMTDRRLLQDQIDTLAAEKSRLQSNVAKAQSDYNLALSRFEMVNGNYTASREENTQLQKRIQSLYEQAAKQDARTQQVAEELVEARSLSDSIKHENANIKGEKDLWQRIEGRLTEDNKNLMDERSRLNKLVADLQNLQNERELAESEAKRRLQTRVDTLESELTESKRKLEHEVEESRKGSQRREYEESQSRTRIDDLVKSLGSVREELVAAKTTRDQLQSRVEEMKIELRAAEEKVAAMQPTAHTNGTSDLPAEQRLSVEISDLRRDLDLAHNELEGAREQVEQYKSIAQSTEEELANFNETSEVYREENDSILAEKNARIQELEQRIEDLSSELTTTNGELSELRTQHDESSRILNEQRTALEAELVRLRDDADRHGEEKKLMREDLRAQAEIAQQAQQSYENELVKHAEATSTLQTLRKEYNELRTEVAGIRAEAEAAKASLERGEESWSEQKERFEQELSDMRTRRSDVDAQNKLLHQQMESFSSELQALRQGRVAAATSDGEGSAQSGGESNLQEVIKFLRREKEIVDVQYELSSQEAKRLQQQLDYTTTQLDDARQKLAEERSQGSERAAQEGSTSRLQKTIEELNLFRESATTLRNENQQAREKLAEKTREVERLVAEVEPLTGRINELEAEVENKDGELKLLGDDRDHWRERTQNIISKYDRVDPAELEELRKHLAELQVEKEGLLAEQAPLREQVEGVEASVAEGKEVVVKEWTERMEKFKNQAKEQNRKQNTRLGELKTASEAATAEQTRLTGELDGVRAELEAAKTARDEALAKASEGAEEEEVGGEGHAELHAKIAEAERQASEHASKAEALSEEVEGLQKTIGELEGQIEGLQEELAMAKEDVPAATDGSEAQTRVQELETQVAGLETELEAAKASSGHDEGEIDESAVDEAALSRLQSELATAQKEVETLRAAATNTAAAPTSENDAMAAQVASEVERLRVEMESQHQLAVKQVEEACERKIQNSKAGLLRQLREEREKMRPDLTAEIREAITAEHQVEVQKIMDEQSATITTLKQEHAAEMEKLRQSGDTAMAEADVKPEAASASFDAANITDDQATELLKHNVKVRAIFTSNVRKNVGKETEALTAKIAEKEAAVSRLTAELSTAQAAAIAAATSSSAAVPAATPDNTAEVAALQAKLDAAIKEKEAAVQKAIEQADKKAKVQISQRDMAQAKIAVVQKAAVDTPEKAVSEVWEIAKAAKPAPKPVANGAGAGTPIKPAAAPVAASSPVTKSAPTLSVASAAAAPADGAAKNDAQAKLEARAARFGTPSTTAAAPTFGQPSVPAPVAGATPSTFGQPSAAPAALQQPARRPSAPAPGPNPTAPAFTPGANRGGSGIPPPGGPAGSKLPRGGGAAAPSGLPRGGGAGLQIQGAAGARGGAQSGLPRGGAGVPRGGRGGRGGPGQALGKRPHDGAGGSGDEKRAKGA
ncbi:hypothetical protein B0A48_05417 [Cryoendolithus antarcticus]|uniref:Uncharacterized protein n=1 Tax=Cryoendolithus antarcticus TaxID=1507870 RepID=A0A1V8TIU6_9PEZI|nr:hypothetical protein B0A48_05417 [Cryoendolithus antarcticus]